MNQPFSHRSFRPSRPPRQPGLLLFALALLLALAAPGSASVRQLTHDTSEDDQPRVNGAGQVIWLAGLPFWLTLELWDGTAVQQLSTDVDGNFDYQIAENGEVVWQGTISGGSQLLLWDGSMVRQLFQGPSGNLHAQVNAAGQVVWQGSDGKTVQIFLWDGQTVRQLTHGTQDSANPQINARGQVVWESHAHIYLWDGQMARELTRSPQYLESLDRYRYPQINDRGQVVWEDTDDSPFGFTFWDGGTTRQIKTPDSFASQLQINNAGLVAFAGFIPDEGDPLYLWDGTMFRRLAPRFYRFLMNAAGEVVWNGNDGVFLWDGNDTRQLGAPLMNTYPDIGLNDAGEVVWEIPGPTGLLGSREIARWDGTRTEIISDTPEEGDLGMFAHGLGIGASGDVVWAGGVDSLNDEIFLYTP